MKNAIIRWIGVVLIGMFFAWVFDAKEAVWVIVFLVPTVITIWKIFINIK